MVQRCVDPVHQTITQLDIQALSDATTLLVLASELWLLMDPFQAGGVSMLGPPLLASTHRHRAIRGGVKTSTGWVAVAGFTAAYPAAMCVDLARFYGHCIRGTVRDPLLRPSALSKYNDIEGWPELRMKEVVAAFPLDAEEAAEEVDEGEEEMLDRQRRREQLVQKVQAGDEDSQPLFERDLPLSKGSLRMTMSEHSGWTRSFFM